MNKFTEEQQAAIDAPGKTIVSASAGSGKTTVMIEKIVRDGIDGIVCYNDVIAFVVSEALEERGLEAGLDYGVVGFDNIQQMLKMPRFLTTVDAGSQAFAEAGANVMLGLLSGGEEQMPAFRDTHKPFLVKGRSTR